MTFAAFLRDMLNVWKRLSRPQKVWVLVALDGVDPADLSAGDRDIARRLFGAIDRVPPEARHVVAMLKGARVGGTWLCSLFLVYRMRFADLSGLADGEQAFAVAVCPDMRLGRQAHRYGLGAVKACAELAAMLVAENSDSFTLLREDGHEVTFEVLPASRGGAAQRGRTLVAALLDEASFFRDPDSGVINDMEVYRAMVVRVIPGGKMLVISTAWLEAGLLHELIQKNHGNPIGAVASICPTLEMRDDARIRQIVAEERERDRENAAREFDCVAYGGGSVQFFPHTSIDASFDADLHPAFSAPMNGTAGVGGDIGLVRDSSAICAVHLVDGMFRVAEILEMRPARGAPLKLSHVVGEFAAFALRHGQTTIFVDHHVLEPAREHLPSGMQLYAPESPDGSTLKVHSHIEARGKLTEGLVRIPGVYGRLGAQLRAITSQPTSGGGFSITSPRRAGAHGDVASAWVLAVLAAERMSSVDLYVGGIKPSTLARRRTLGAHLGRKARSL